MTNQDAADHEQRAKLQKPGAQPAAGYWRCRPTDFWAAPNIIGRMFTQAAIVLLFTILLIVLVILFFKLETAPLWLRAFAVVAMVIAGFFFAWRNWDKWIGLQRDIVRYEGEKFHIDVVFDSVIFNAVRGGDLVACNKFGKKTAHQQDEESSGLSSNEAVALQNLLPRLYGLQRAGGDGLLRVTKPDSRTWVFRYERSPLKRVFFIVPLSIVVAALAGGLTFQAVTAASMISASVALAVSAIVLWALLGIEGVPGRLRLLVHARDNGNVVDMHWQEQRGPLTETHAHWASLGNAKPLTEFCDYLVSFHTTLTLQFFSVEEPNLEPDNNGHSHA